MAAAWIDHDGDGRPDIVFATCFRGLRSIATLARAKIPGSPRVTSSGCALV
jgi:hypothetical protein